MLTISWRKPSRCTRVVIIVIVCAGTYHFAPHEMMPVFLGSLIGALAGEPSRSLSTRNSEA